MVSVLQVVTIFLLVVAIFLLALPYFVGSPTKGILSAENSSVVLVTKGKHGNDIAYASGVRLNDKFVLSCAHIFENGEFVFLEGEKLHVVGVDAKDDLALFKVNTNRKTMEDLEIAQSVFPFDDLYDCSNANSRQGTLNRYLVKRHNGSSLDIDKPVIPGESGAGLFNSRGQLSGIATGGYEIPYAHQPDPKRPTYFATYGTATSPEAVRSFLGKIRDRDFESYYSKVVVQNWFDRIMWRFY